MADSTITREGEDATKRDRRVLIIFALMEKARREERTHRLDQRDLDRLAAVFGDLMRPAAEWAFRGEGPDNPMPDLGSILAGIGQTARVPVDAPQHDALTAGIQAGLDAAIRGIDATILNMGGECSRRGIQDPETGEVPCEGEEDRGCACSEALELGARLIKNLRTCDVAKIAALATGGARHG